MAYPTINKSYAQTVYNVSWSGRRSVKYIVCHYTGTDASAKNNCIYFSGGNRNASADYFIDKDGSIYQFNADPKNYFSWHCGDGYGKYGITNTNSIGIEVVSSGAEYTQAQKDALRDLVIALMKDYGVSASNVVRHYDASGKLCPAPYCGSSAKNDKWNKLHTYITQDVKEGDWLDMATMKEVQQAVWGYVNENLESVDTYQILRDIRDDGARKTWGYQNEGLEKVDAYQILRDIRDEVVELRKEIEALKESK